MSSASRNSLGVPTRISTQLLFDQVDLSSVQPLMIDEFSVRKGHRYATVVMDGVEKNGLWGGMDKSEKNLQTFFDWLTKKNRFEQIRSVTCDMSVAYPRMVRESLANTRIIYVLFHVVSNSIQDVLVLGKISAPMLGTLPRNRLGNSRRCGSERCGQTRHHRPQP